MLTRKIVLEIVIIGFGAASYSALTTIKKLNPEAKVTIIQLKKNELFHPRGLPYALEGNFDPEKLMHKNYLDKMGVIKIQGYVEKIDNKKKQIIYTENSEKKTISYDKALITTGSQPFIPVIKGLPECIGKTVFSLTSLEDSKKILLELKDKQNIAIIGAGAIGLESAITLSKTIQKIFILEKEDQILSGVLDKDLSEIVEKYIRTLGINIILNCEVKKLNMYDGSLQIKSELNNFEADIAILAVGFKPNTKIAEESGINYNNLGIITNPTLETSVESIYAAGDCIMPYSIIDQKPINRRLATSSYKMGKIVAKNMCNQKKTVYLGTAATFATKIADLEIATTGYNKQGAIDAGYNPAVVKVNLPLLPDYFEENSEIIIKIIADKDKGHLLGAQAIGKRGAVSRINLISTAIEFNIPLHEIERIEMAYCPAISQIHDPLFKALESVQKRIKKK